MAMVPGPTGILFYTSTTHTVWLLPHGFVNPRFVTAEGLQVCAGVVINKKINK